MESEAQLLRGLMENWQQIASANRDAGDVLTNVVKRQQRLIEGQRRVIEDLKEERLRIHRTLPPTHPGHPEE